MKRQIVKLVVCVVTLGAASSDAQSLTRPFEALGDRLRKPGKERINLSGQLTDSSGVSEIALIQERGSKTRLDVANKPEKSFRFDGTNAPNIGSPQAETIFESLADDTPDALIEHLRSGSVPRLLGNGFALPGGGKCDLYDVPTRSNAQKNGEIVLRRYCFDSNTQLLRSVQYLKGKGARATAVTVEFRGWHTVEGQAVPSEIERRDDGAFTFKLTLQAASFSAKSNDNVFK